MHEGASKAESLRCCVRWGSPAMTGVLRFSAWLEMFCSEKSIRSALKGKLGAMSSCVSSEGCWGCLVRAVEAGKGIAVLC